MRLRWVLTLVGAKEHIPYDRLLLSKDYLSGSLDEADLALWPVQEYGNRDIELSLGVPAVRLAAAERRLILGDGRQLRYDRLIIATGGQPTQPALKHPAVLSLRDLRDAARLRKALAQCPRLVIIGGGFVGCELAAAATANGTAVTMVEAARSPLGQVLGPEVGGASLPCTVPTVSTSGPESLPARWRMGQTER